MKRVMVALVLAGLMVSCSTEPTPTILLAPSPVAVDRLDIRSVKFLPASSAEFVVFVVAADYTLASSAEGNVGLALDLEPGHYTLVSEQRVWRGAGTVELMAECKRGGRSTQVVSLGLSEYPGSLPRKTLASQVRTVALAAAP